MIVHRQKNHTDEEHKVSKYLSLSPKKGWQQDKIIAGDLSQSLLVNVIW